MSNYDCKPEGQTSPNLPTIRSVAVNRLFVANIILSPSYHRFDQKKGCSVAEAALFLVKTMAKMGILYTMVVRYTPNNHEVTEPALGCFRVHRVTARSTYTYLSSHIFQNLSRKNQVFLSFSNRFVCIRENLCIFPLFPFHFLRFTHDANASVHRPQH